MTMIHWIRHRASYANVASSLALFVALGGTSYAALTLPANSVGSRQIRSQAVTAAELHTGAVASRDIRNRSIRLADVSTSTRRALRGQQGPAGPQGPAGTALRAAVSSGGAAMLGNARGVEHVSGTNEYAVAFDREVAACVATATLASVQAGPTLEQPQPGRITVATRGDRAVIRTFATDGSPAEQPFHLMLAC